MGQHYVVVFPLRAMDETLVSQLGYLIAQPAGLPLRLDAVKTVYAHRFFEKSLNALIIVWMISTNLVFFISTDPSVACCASWFTFWGQSL